MARQLRQTRGKKGPRKTRKQGKRKGGKTRKRVMGKRRKRTMRGGLFGAKVEPVVNAPTPTSINEDGANEQDYVKLTREIDKDNIIGKEPKEGRTYIATYHKGDSMMVLEDMNSHEFIGIRTGMSDTKNNTISAFEAVDKNGKSISTKRN